MALHPRKPHAISSVVTTLRDNEMLLALSTMMVIISIGISMVAPILPIYGRDFGVSSTMVGLLVTSFAISRVFVNLPAGRLADRIGRRPLIIAGPLTTAVGSILAAIAPDFWTLVSARLIQGVGSALYATAAMTALADVSTVENRGRVMTTYQGSLLIGASLGPTIGGLSAHVAGVRGVFVIYAALTSLAAVWAAIRIKETLHSAPVNHAPSDSRKPKDVTPSDEGSPWALMVSASFLAVSFASFMIFFTRAGGRSTIVPLLGSEKLGMGESTLGLIFTVVSLFNIIALPMAGWGIDRFGRKPVIVPSLMVTALGTALFALSGNTAMFVAAAAVSGIGAGIAGPAPAAYAADLAGTQSYGTAMGLFRTASDVGFVVGPVLLGWIADQRGYPFSLYFNTVLIFLASLAFALLARETRRARPPAGAISQRETSPSRSPLDD